MQFASNKLNCPDISHRKTIFNRQISEKIAWKRLSPMDVLKLQQFSQYAISFNIPYIQRRCLTLRIGDIYRGKL